MTKTFKLYFISFFLIVFQFKLFGQVQVTLPQLEGFEDEEILASLKVNNLTNYNIKAFQFKLYYDSEIISIQEAKIGNVDGLSNGFFTKETNVDLGILGIAWASTSSLTGEGDLVLFKIKLKKSGVTKLSFYGSDSVNTFIFNDGNIFYNYSDGSVKVKGPSIRISNVIINNSSLSEISVPITISDFINIGSISLKLSYDPSVITYKRSENISQNINLAVSENNGIISMGWFDLTGNTPITLNDGKFADLIFDYQAGACLIKFIQPQCEITNSSAQVINIQYYDGAIEVPTYLKEDKSYINDFFLEQNFPNPFNDKTKIKYSIPYDGYVTLKLFNSIGREIFKTNIDYVVKGVYEFYVDCSFYASGIYFLVLEYKSSENNFRELTASRKLILLK